MDPQWTLDDPGRTQIFCAALAGLVANPAFFGPLFQQRSDLAVAFAADCVTEAVKLQERMAGAQREPF